MKISAHNLAATSPIAIAVATVLFFGVGEAQQTTTLQTQIVGTWLAVSQYVDQDGTNLEPFGSNPKGMVVYDPNGRFVLVLQRAT